MRADYKLPLPVLRGYLGPSTLKEFESPQIEGAYHRAWRCGCIAQYRYSAHQTAIWRPCATHRARPDETELAVPSASEPSGNGPEHRSSSSFFIIDADLKVLCKSSGSEVEHLMGLASDAIARVVADGKAAVVPVEGDTVLRMMPVHGDPVTAFAVVIEGRRRGRNRLTEAANRYNLTRRETEVLRSLLIHRTSSEIAEALCIAESTVSDHVKSLFRKTDCKRRAELLTKLFLL